MPQQETCDCRSEDERLLLVEGVNDCHAIYQLMWLVHKTGPVFGIHECGNDERVLESLAARLVSSVPNQKALGVVLDSDVEGVGAGQVIQSRLDQLRPRVGEFYPLPDVFPNGGLILDPLSTRP